MKRKYVEHVTIVFDLYQLLLGNSHETQQTCGSVERDRKHCEFFLTLYDNFLIELSPLETSDEQRYFRYPS